MASRIISQKLVRTSPALAALGSGLVILFALFPANAGWRRDATDKKLEESACASFDECVDGCQAGYHCNRTVNGVRSCEPDTVIPGSLEVVLPGQSKPQPSAWKPKKDISGCPITSYGKYKKGTDGKCHWLPDNAVLAGRNNKWQCAAGYEKVKAKPDPAPQGKSKDYECRKK